MLFLPPNHLLRSFPRAEKQMFEIAVDVHLNMSCHGRVFERTVKQRFKLYFSYEICNPQKIKG